MEGGRSQPMKGGVLAAEEIEDGEGEGSAEGGSALGGVDG